MRNSTLGTIWWDFDGTLVSRPFMWSEAAFRLVSQAVPEHGISLQKLRDVLSTGFPWHRPDHAHTDLATPDLWWSSVYERYLEALLELDCPLTEKHALLAAIRDDILDARRYSVFADVVPVLDQLHRRGWRQVVVSNHVPELRQIVDGLGLGRFFHVVVSSGVVGYEKPHARIFEAALAHTLPAAPIWMIGDNVHADCTPAKSFGAEAILVRTGAPFERRANDLWAALEFIVEAESGSDGVPH